MCFTEFHLQAYGFMASLVQQRIVIAAHEDRWHQILEHGAAPGEQRLPSMRRSYTRPCQSKPVLWRNVTLRDRHEARQAALTGEQVIVAGELDRSADRV